MEPGNPEQQKSKEQIMQEKVRAVMDEIETSVNEAKRNGVGSKYYRQLPEHGWPVFDFNYAWDKSFSDTVMQNVVRILKEKGWGVEVDRDRTGAWIHLWRRAYKSPDRNDTDIHFYSPTS